MLIKSLYYDNFGIARAIIVGDSGKEYCTNIRIDEEDDSGEDYRVGWCTCPAFIYRGYDRDLDQVNYCKHIFHLLFNLERNKMVDKKKQLYHLPTGSQIIDDLLGGGIPYALLTAIFSEPALGKSWLAYQTGVNNLKISKKKTLLIDTEGLRYIDLMNILKKLGKRFDVDNKTIEKNFKLTKTYDDPQLQSIQKLMQMFGYMVTFTISDKGKYKVIFQHCDATLTHNELEDISMIIVDSLTKPIKDSVGSETANLPARAQIVERLFGKLYQIADIYNIAIMVLHHASVPPPVGPYRKNPHAYGGNPIYYNSKYILQFWPGTKKEKDIIIPKSEGKGTWGVGARRIVLIRRPDEQADGVKIPIRLKKDFGFVDE